MYACLHSVRIYTHTQDSSHSVVWCDWFNMRWGCNSTLTYKPTHTHTHARTHTHIRVRIGSLTRAPTRMKPSFSQTLCRQTALTKIFAPTMPMSSTRPCMSRCVCVSERESDRCHEFGDACHTVCVCVCVFVCNVWPKDAVNLAMLSPCVCVCVRYMLQWLHELGDAGHCVSIHFCVIDVCANDAKDGVKWRLHITVCVCGKQCQMTVLNDSVQ